MNRDKKQIITISGRPGSGKSTTAKKVAELLNYRHFSSGDLFRSISKEHGQDVLQSNLEAEKESGVSKIDQLVDQRLRDIGAEESHIVIDSRMAWHWMPNSFKIFLDLDIETAARRVLDDMTQERIEAERIPSDPVVYAMQLKERLDSESRRYKRMYDINPYNLSNYNLVIDTKKNDIKAVVSIVMDSYRDWSDDFKAVA